MPNTSRPLWLAAALLLVAGALAGWIAIGPMRDPKPILVAPLDKGCNLRMGPCDAVFPDGSRVAFEITPHHIPVLRKLQLRVHTQGIEARRVEVDFSGADMNMGLNRATLEPGKPHELTGAIMLPVCVRARMTWNAEVLLYTERGLLAAPFRFDTYLPGREPDAATQEANPG